MGITYGHLADLYVTILVLIDVHRITKDVWREAVEG